MNRFLNSTSVLQPRGRFRRDTIWNVVFHNLFRSYVLLAKLDTYGAFLTFRNTELQMMRFIPSKHRPTINREEERANARAEVARDYPFFQLTDRETKQAIDHLDTLRVPVLDDATEKKWKQLLEQRKELVAKFHDALNSRNARRLDVFWKKDPEVKTIRR